MFNFPAVMFTTHKSHFRFLVGRPCLWVHCVTAMRPRLRLIRDVCVCVYMSTRLKKKNVQQPTLKTHVGNGRYVVDSTAALFCDLVVGFVKSSEDNLNVNVLKKDHGVYGKSPEEIEEGPMYVIIKCIMYILNQS